MLVEESLYFSNDLCSSSNTDFINGRNLTCLVPYYYDMTVDGIRMVFTRPVSVKLQQGFCDPMQQLTTGGICIDCYAKILTEGTSSV